MLSKMKSTFGTTSLFLGLKGKKSPCGLRRSAGLHGKNTGTRPGSGGDGTREEQSRFIQADLAEPLKSWNFRHHPTTTICWAGTPGTGLNSPQTQLILTSTMRRGHSRLKLRFRDGADSLRSCSKQGQGQDCTQVYQPQNLSMVYYNISSNDSSYRYGRLLPL